MKIQEGFKKMKRKLERGKKNNGRRRERMGSKQRYQFYVLMLMDEVQTDGKVLQAYIEWFRDLREGF